MAADLRAQRLAQTELSEQGTNAPAYVPPSPSLAPKSPSESSKSGGVDGTIPDLSKTTPSSRGAPIPSPGGWNPSAFTIKPQNKEENP